LTKAVKEVTLATSKTVYDFNCVSSSCRKQLLISLEKPFVVLQVREVVIIEVIRRRLIKVG
jgi:hypothetical protein